MYVRVESPGFLWLLPGAFVLPFFVSIFFGHEHKQTNTGRVTIMKTYFLYNTTQRDGHLVGTTFDENGEVLRENYIVRCRKVGCENSYCRRSLYSEASRALENFVYSRHFSTLITISHAGDSTEESREVVRETISLLKKHVNSNSFAYVATVEPHKTHFSKETAKEKSLHVHILLSHETKLPRSFLSALKETFPHSHAQTRNTQAKNAHKHINPAYIIKRFKNLHSSHVELNGGRIFLSTSKNAWSTKETRQVQREGEKCSRSVAARFVTERVKVTNELIKQNIMTKDEAWKHFHHHRSANGVELMNSSLVRRRIKEKRKSEAKLSRQKTLEAKKGNERNARNNSLAISPCSKNNSATNESTQRNSSCSCISLCVCQT